MSAGRAPGGGRRFEFLEAVTSDLAFVARGGSVEEAFAAAAEALLAATVAEPARVEARTVERIALREPDFDLLLLAFLNELVWLRDARGLLLRVREIVIRRAPGARGAPAARGAPEARGEPELCLEATLEGEALDPARHALEAEVKAATAHGLSVRDSAAGWEARATLDV